MTTSVERRVPSGATVIGTASPAKHANTCASYLRELTAPRKPVALLDV